MIIPDDTFAAAQREIAYAYERMPFFRRHMEEAGVRPGDIRRPGDLSRIPPTEKSLYRKHFPGGILAEGVSLSDPRLRHLPSSGTTDERLLTVEWSALWAKRCLDACKVHPAVRRGLRADRHCYYIPPSCSGAECSSPADGGKAHPVPGGLMLPVLHDVLATDADRVSEALRGIADFAPSLYMVSPTHLAFLVRHMAARGFRPPAAPVLATYSLCTRMARRQILEAFPQGTAFSEVVGMSELGFLAAECPRGGLHLNTGAFHCELRAGGRDAEPGELAELVVTTIDRGCSPHIRYRTGDAYRSLGERCPCGAPSPLVRMEGRIRNLLLLPGGGRLTPRELDEAVGDDGWMRLYRMEQTEADAFFFTYLPAAGGTDRSAGLAETLLRRLGGKARLTVRRAEHLPAAGSGKFMECESRVAARAAAEGLRL